MSLPLNEGTILSGRYIIRHILGQGGMGAVYLGIDTRIPDKKWAIKELWDFGDPSTQQLVQNQFKQEAAILAALDHPNLPRITDFFVDNNKEYLVMDFVEGSTLEDIIKNNGKPLEPDFCVDMASQLIDVLEYLHKQNPPLIFRDLKPANIMITPDRRVKLIDFGIARVFASGKTKDTVIMGTPGYASPEQYGTSQSTVRSDIYGLGATLYYALTCSDPADNPFRFEPLQTLNPAVPARLANAVLKCVQMNPDDRFADVGELRDYLLGEKGITAGLAPDPAGAKKGPSGTESLEGVSVNPELIDFGQIRRGAIYRQKIRVNGKVVNGSVSSDREWIKVYPPLIDGSNPGVNVTVHTGSLNNGGKYQGQVVMKGEGFDRIIPVKLEVEAKHLNFLSYVLAFIFTLLSLIPVVGFLGFFLNLIMYFSIPRGERLSIKIFLYITLFISILWGAVIGVLYFFNVIPNWGFK
ncbi:MAG: serine/threonine protein kinase [Firmicutes bacterium]|nr:serine/threonine protein kinase [Bacillota bacterium]